MQDLESIVKAIGLGSVLFLTGLVFIFGLGSNPFPRSVLVLETMLNLILIGGIRFSMRWSRETFLTSRTKKQKFVLIVGAGETGTQLLREIRMNPRLGVQVVGFIDDNPSKKDDYIQGIRVLGSCREVPRFVAEMDIDEIFISLPSAGYHRITAIIEQIKPCGIPVKSLPSLTDIINKNGLWRQLKDVSADELLGRTVLKFRRETDISLLADEIAGKVVLVTGAGGSIGSELCRQVAQRKPELLILFERNENALYFLELELRRKFPKCHLAPIVGDILNSQKLTSIISSLKVDIIYHAAAYKHVPMMEREPVEAVKNNIVASREIARVALENNVDKFIYISTDKAVNPTSMMGATKRVGELIMQALSGGSTQFIAVRFGNVIGSNGSVIPLFKEQIAHGGPVTVTHPEASRYFMAISEAVQLVMTAAAMGRGGEIFLLDMGQPIKIVDMATNLIKASGLVPEKDIEIKFTGLRPGEKLHEELFWQGENIVPTVNKKITMLRSNGVDREFILSQVDYLAKKYRDKY
jgi:FlaA1/EpsC-like NDP-sugar epimerase